MRTVIQIIGRNGNIFDAIVTGFGVVSAPLETIPDDLQPLVNTDQRFFARVHEEVDGAITLTDFEIAPDPDPTDGLG